MSTVSRVSLFVSWSPPQWAHWSGRTGGSTMVSSFGLGLLLRPFRLPSSFSVAGGLSGLAGGVGRVPRSGRGVATGSALGVGSGAGGEGGSGGGGGGESEGGASGGGVSPEPEGTSTGAAFFRLRASSASRRARSSPMRSWRRPRSCAASSRVAASSALSSASCVVNDATCARAEASSSSRFTHADHHTRAPPASLLIDNPFPSFSFFNVDQAPARNVRGAHAGAGLRPRG